MDELEKLSIHYINFRIPISDTIAFKNLKNTNGYLINYKSILKEL